MGLELRKYWYNSGVVIKEVDEKRVVPFQFSPLSGGGEEGKGFSVLDPSPMNKADQEPVNHGKESGSVKEQVSIDEKEIDAVFQDAKKRGFEEGKAEGLKKGYEEGFAKGKEEGFTAGFQEGFEKGFQEGKREGLALSEKRFQGILERAKESLEHLSKVRKELQENLKSYEAELVSLAFQIGASIAMKEIEEKPESIGEIVQKALEKIGESSEVVVKLNPKDLSVLKESGQIETEGIQLVSSPSIKRGGCVVETDKGVVNATLETRIKEVADSLIKAGEANACN